MGLRTRDNMCRPRDEQEHVLDWKNTRNGNAVMTLQGRRLDIYYFLPRLGGAGSFTVDPNYDRRTRLW